MMQRFPGTMQLLAAAVLVLPLTLAAFSQPPGRPEPPPWTQGEYTAPAAPGIGTKVSPQAGQLPGIYHPYPQPFPKGTVVALAADGTIIVNSGRSVLPTPYIDPFARPPGTNLLPTVYTNIFDLQGKEVANTLPSTQRVPYNLHDGDPIVTEINQRSPTDDLHETFRNAERLLEQLTELEARIAAAKDPAARQAFEAGRQAVSDQLEASIGFGIRIIRGDKLDVDEGPLGKRVYDRAYDGFPLLHYNAVDQVRTLEPVYEDGKLIGGNVDVKQIWYDSHIESDTAYIDFTGIPEKLWDLEWTMTFTVDVLARGHDDFSPWMMYMQKKWDLNCEIPKLGEPCKADNESSGKVDPSTKGLPKPLVGFDASFFPMEDGTRSVIKIKMAPPKYFNLAYTWGWRMHPPRIQVVEHMPKKVAYLKVADKPEDWNQKQKSIPDYALPSDCARDQLKPLCKGTAVPILDFEKEAFCRNGQDCDVNQPENKKYAISQIGRLAPSRRMLAALQYAEDVLKKEKYEDAEKAISYAESAWEDWRDRTALPAGIMVSENGGEPVPVRKSTLWDEVDQVVFYVNNTMYGEWTDGSLRKFHRWKLRDGAINHRAAAPENFNRVVDNAGTRQQEQSVFRVALINGDYFDHGYQSVDFGGARGWENQFKSSVKFGGSGCWFTFGRGHWWKNITPGAVRVPAADKPGGPKSKASGKYVFLDQRGNKLGYQRVHMVFNYEPSVRLRFYQFDPVHHSQCIFSQH